MMGEVATAAVRKEAFRCGGCGKRYRWSGELVGRVVRCACGKEMAVPVVPEPRAAGVAVGYEGKGATGGAGKGGSAFPDWVKDFQVPVGLLGAGVVVEVLAGWLGGEGVRGALAGVGARVAVGTVLMVVAMLIAGRLRGIDFGPRGAAVLKLAALAVAPSAAMTLLGVFLSHVPLGMIGVWVLGFCFYFALVGVLFDLDQSDTWYCVVVIFVVKVVVVIALMGVAARG